MKGYLHKSLLEAVLVWLALTVGVMITSILYTVLIISQVPKSTSLLISFVTLVALIILGSFLPTKSIFLSFRHRKDRKTEARLHSGTQILTSERKLLLIFVTGCLLIIGIGILLLSLWHYRELIGFLIVGLAIISVLVMLAIRIIQTLTDSIVKIQEQKLRQERLRPNDYGYYEIPLGEEENDRALPPS